MTMEKTKAQLTHLLADKDNKVIALTGKWGTGKSYLWNEVKNESKDDAVKKALYVSLFGLSDMDQVKFKLLQSAIPRVKANGDLFNQVKILWNNGLKFLRALDGRFAAIDNLQLLVVPNLLKGKVIVLDDIERKHEKLNIDEVLGFIDEYTQQNGARFVLIFNSDKLVDVDLWNTFREKVVDQEIGLNTSPSEAFDIAIRLSPSSYEKEIREVSKRCDLTNIRVIRKVIKVVNSILEKQIDPSDVLLRRVIPSTVLLAAVHYKGIENGPDLQFILNYSLVNEVFNNSQNDSNENRESDRTSKWKLLLKDLGIELFGDYEHQVNYFLHSGLIDVEAVQAIINQYAMEDSHNIFYKNLREFVTRLEWDPKQTDEALLNESIGLEKNINWINAQDFSSLYYAIEKLTGGLDVAKRLMEKWLEALQDKDYDYYETRKISQQNIHPKIQKAFESYERTKPSNIEFSDACISIISNDWNKQKIQIMKMGKAVDFENAIKSFSAKNLWAFVDFMVEIIKHPSQDEKTLGNIHEPFIEACKNIVKDPHSGRLGKIIQREFGKINRNDLLTPDTPSNT